MAYKTVQYCFTFQDDTQEIFNLYFHNDNLDIVQNVPQNLPPWTDIAFHQCTNCPLDTREFPHCPIAVNLVQIVDRFQNRDPQTPVHLDVITEERLIVQDTIVQSGISSLMGLIMATSGCPHMAFFKPMARFHLALASEEETVYRAASMYLLAQYFLKKEGRDVDLNLEGMSRIYRDIHIVNTAIVERLRAARQSNPSLDAIVLLDMYALFLPHVIEKSLDEVRYLFKPFLDAQSSEQPEPEQ